MRMRAAVRGALVGVLALSACTAHPSPLPSSPAPTVTVAATVTATVTAAAEPSAAARDVAAFRSDTTACEFDAPDSDTPGVGCPMSAEYTYAIPDTWLEFGIPCSTISLGYEDQEGRLGCASDVSFPDAEGTDPLPPGTVVTHNGITCTLLAAGVTCTNTVGAVTTLTPEGYVAATD